MKKARLLVILTIASASIFCFAYQQYLNGWYIRNAPSAPNAVTGEIYEVTEHSTRYYVTGADRAIYVLLLPTGVGLIFLCTLVSNVWKK